MALALYRKYRPQTFEELVGQDAVKKILSTTSARYYTRFVFSLALVTVDREISGA